jgi:hypothetical protein
MHHPRQPPIPEDAKISGLGRGVMTDPVGLLMVKFDGMRGERENVRRACRCERQGCPLLIVAGTLLRSFMYFFLFLLQVFVVVTSQPSINEFVRGRRKEGQVIIPNDFMAII